MALALFPARAKASSMQRIGGPIPATMCQKTGTSGALAVFADGAVGNEATSGSLTIDCPIPNAAQGVETGGSTYFLTYFDDSPDFIGCSLRSEDAASTAVIVKALLSSGDGSPIRRMTFPSFVPFANGHMHVRCTIPPKDPQGHMSSVKGMYFDDDDIQFVGDTIGSHTFPGSNCRRVLSGSSLSITTDGAVTNPSALGQAATEVDCPVVTSRERVDGSGGVTIAGTRLWYLDDSPQNLSCTLWAESDGGASFNGRSLASTQNDNGYHSLDFSGASAVTTYPNGFLHYRCNIPAGAGADAAYIVGYGFQFQ